MLVYCIQMTEDIAKLLSRPGKPVTLVFVLERRYLIPRETPKAVVQNAWGGENLIIFQLKSPFIS